MWKVEFEPARKMLTVNLLEEVPVASMRELTRAVVDALDATGGTDFRMFVDLRGMMPLEADAVSLFAEIKRVSSQMPRFRGMMILVDSPTVALQQQRTQPSRGS